MNNFTIEDMSLDASVLDDDTIYIASGPLIKYYMIRTMFYSMDEDTFY